MEDEESGKKKQKKKRKSREDTARHDRMKLGKGEQRSTQDTANQTVARQREKRPRKLKVKGD